MGYNGWHCQTKKFRRSTCSSLIRPKPGKEQADVHSFVLIAAHHLSVADCRKLVLVYIEDHAVRLWLGTVSDLSFMYR